MCANLHKWMPAFKHWHAYTWANVQSICVWICVSLGLSAGISIDHLTSRWRVTDEDKTKPVLLSVSVRVWLGTYVGAVGEWRGREACMSRWARLHVCGGRVEEWRLGHSALTPLIYVGVWPCAELMCVCGTQNDRKSWPKRCCRLSWWCSPSQPEAIHALWLGVKGSISLKPRDRLWVMKRQTSNKEHSVTFLPGPMANNHVASRMSH